MRWTPAHEAHAIERVSMTVSFNEQAASKTWPSLIATLSSKLHELGFSSQIAATGVPPGFLGIGQPLAQIVVGPAGVTQSFGEGRTFQIVEGNTLREDIQFFRDRVLYSATRYVGWSGFFSRYRELLGSEVDLLLTSMSPAIVQLEYWDRFNFQGPQNEVAYEELFAPNSRYLPHFARDARDLMHSHVGFFADSPEGHKRLININVDSVDLMQMTENGQPEPKRSVGVYTLAQDRITSDRGREFDAAGLTSTFDQQHTILKDVIGDVINSAMADRISLKATP